MRRPVAAGRATVTRAAAASAPHVAAAARAALRLGNAVDAVLAGVFAAAAESPTVVLGPLQILMGGVGAGLLALDGRVRQPGLGVPRPRGFITGEAVPPSALVAVPSLPAAVAAAAALAGSLRLAQIAGPSIEMAKATSPERASFIERIARRGSRGLVDDVVAGELMAVAGRSARGLLTLEDLSSLLPAVVPCHPEGSGGDGVVKVPWRLVGAAGSSSTHVVAACDGNGLVSVACYEAPTDGLAIPALGVVAPPFAAPVLRGSPRVRPGDVRAAAAPIALRIRRGLADLAFGVGAAEDAEEALDGIVRSLRDVFVLRDALSSSGTGRLVAIVRGREAKALASE